MGMFVDQQAVLNFDGKPQGDLTEASDESAGAAETAPAIKHVTVGVKGTGA